MRRSSKVLAALGLASLAAAGGSAFTASNTPPSAADARLGFVSVTATGVTLQSIHYDLNATGTAVTTVHVKVLGDTSHSAMAVGFNGQNTDDCATGVYDSTTYTDYACTTTGQNLSISTTAIVSVEVVVH
jgi:hypothetical protein